MAQAPESRRPTAACGTAVMCNMSTPHAATGRAPRSCLPTSSTSGRCCARRRNRCLWTSKNLCQVRLLSMTGSHTGADCMASAEVWPPHVALLQSGLPPLLPDSWQRPRHPQVFRWLPCASWSRTPHIKGSGASCAGAGDAGVVLAAFGTALSLPPHGLVALARAFASLPQVLHVLLSCLT